jgi:hypothetical protein
MIFVGAGLVPAQNGGKHKALPLQNANDFLIGINSNERRMSLENSNAIQGTFQIASELQQGITVTVQFPLSDNILR